MDALRPRDGCPTAANGQQGRPPALKCPGHSEGRGDVVGCGQTGLGNSRLGSEAESWTTEWLLNGHAGTPWPDGLYFCPYSERKIHRKGDVSSSTALENTHGEVSYLAV